MRRDNLNAPVIPALNVMVEVRRLNSHAPLSLVDSLYPYDCHPMPIRGYIPQRPYS